MTDSTEARTGGEGARPATRVVAERLAADADRLTGRWHRELEERLRIRPQNVFPGSELLDGMPALIRWIAVSLGNGREMEREQTRSLHELAGHWRRSGYAIEESLLHVRILGRILQRALRDAIEDVEGDVDGAQGAALAERLCHSLGEVESVLVGTYRDAEEERLADLGGTLAHEIRGELATAVAAADMLRLLESEEPEDAEARRDDAIDRIKRAAQGATALVDAVRTFSRVRAGMEEWTLRPLSAVVEDVVASIRRQGSDGIRIDVVDELPDDEVPAEAVQLVLHNLVANAVAYADPAKEDRWTRIHCRGEDDRGRWVVQVGDNGLGIPDEEQERIFRRFLRGKRARGEGFGLGLSIARQAAHSMGGSVMLEKSRRGEGTTFSVAIPMLSADDVVERGDETKAGELD